MGNFKKLNTKLYERKGPDLTPDFIYWKQLSPAVLVKEFGPIDYIDFSPKEPHYFAVTCSVRVQVYNPITKLVTRNLSRFRENAYGAVFRNDGTLILAGGEEKNVKLFDVSTKSMLRLFKGHTAPVHRVGFIHKQPQIVTFSDDKTVKVWDIPSEAILNSFEGHNDYIRAGIAGPDLPNIILSGGYDNIIKMWDTRTNKEVMIMDHKSPIESLLFMPSGGMFLSAGGTDIKIWDALAGGKLRGALAQHHKTVTCLKLASNGTRLLSGSLDRHVKIFDVSSFKVVHTLDFPNSILSMGIAPDDSTVAVGLVDGVIAVQRRIEEAEPKKVQKKPNPEVKEQYPSGVDEVVSDLIYDKEAKYDHYLRKFEFRNALNAVLLPYIINKHPERTVALLHELEKRKALVKALWKKEPKTIRQLLRFFIKYLPDIRYTRYLIDVASQFLDIIAPDLMTFDKDMAFLLRQFSDILTRELELVQELVMVEGGVETLLAAQISIDPDENSKLSLHNVNGAK